MLFSTTAGAGHFGPQIPVARACLDAGHDVAVAAPASFADHVAGAGFAFRSFPDAPADQMAAVFATLPGMSHEEADRVVIAEVFGRLDAQAAFPGLLEIIGDWQPDVIVRDPSELASLVAAELLDIPQLQVAIGIRRFLDYADSCLDAPIRDLEAIAGLPTPRGADLLSTTPTLTSVPPTLDHSSGAATGTSRARGPVWRFRTPDQPSTANLPDAWGEPRDPLVYVSFGSVAAVQGRFNRLYSGMLEVLAGLPVRVLMTTGRGLDLAQLGPQPANARVLPWWPQESAMPETALAIGHGGFGTTMTAVRAGVPQIVIPLFSSDQFMNAELIAEVGAGIALPGGAEATSEVPDAVTTLLQDRRFAETSAGLAAEINALPDVSSAVDVIAGLARGEHGH